MQVDCRNLDCPKPVIKTKEALKELKIGESLSILVNDLAPFENVKRFFLSNKFEVKIIQHENYTEIKTIKTRPLSDDLIAKSDIIKEKVLYLNDDKAGVGEVGVTLLSSFLSTISNLINKPTKIICVNNAVFMTSNRAHTSYQILKNLESQGIEILVCGNCLKAYDMVDKLSIGRVSNAYEIMEILTNYEVIKL